MLPSGEKPMPLVMPTSPYSSTAESSPASRHSSPRDLGLELEGVGAQRADQDPALGIRKEVVKAGNIVALEQDAPLCRP